MDTTRLMKPEQAEQRLIELGYIRLPAYSYFKWVLKDRFESYKPLLSFKHGKWIPRIDKIQELNQLDDAFKAQDWKTYGAEQHAKEEIESLVKIEAPVFNGAGEQLPF